METSAIAINQFENTLWSLKNKFLISIDNYREELKQQYLEGNKNTSGTGQNQLNDTWAKTFNLYSQVNSNIIQNNKTIESLDEYLDLLKAEVDIENTLLNQTIGTQQAAVPREKYIRKTSRDNYMMAAYYVAAVLGTSVIIYRHFQK